MSSLNDLNLATAPFVNRRPRRRVSLVLWSVAAVLVCWNAFLFIQYWLGSSSGRGELREVRERIDHRVDELEALEDRLVRTDLAAQNAQVRFLNRKIAERTFPWSRLFDHMVAVMPRDVRLDRLAPSIPEEERGREVDATTRIEWIGLEIRATAKTSEDVLELLDALFEHSAFSRPRLSDERVVDQGVEFGVSVRYRVAEPSPEPSRDDGVQVTEDPRPAEAQPTAANGSDRAGVDRADAAEPGVRGPRSGGDGESAGRATPSSPVDRGALAAERRTTPSGEATASPGSRRETARGQDVRSAAGRRVTTGSRSDTPASRAVAPVDESTGDIADERFGRDEPVAPRLPNASGSDNGGPR